MPNWESSYAAFGKSGIIMGSSESADVQERALASNEWVKYGSGGRGKMSDIEPYTRDEFEYL